MDYELMMNGTVKIGQHAPDFTSETTYGPINLNDYKGKSLHKSLSMNKSTKSFTAANSLNTSMSSVVTVKQPTSNTKDLKKRMNMFKHEFDIVDSKYVNNINNKSKTSKSV